MMNFGDDESDPVTDPARLSIGEVAERTGLSVADLRNWESRYGLPRPARTPSGQRRYRESDVLLIGDIVRRRDAGLSLGPAIREATAGRGRRDSSIYRGLRQRHPQLAVHTMAKPLLLALTWAIEDQCAAGSQDPILLAAFQKTRFYRSAQQRWADLATTATATVVFADFDRPAVRHGDVTEIPIAPDSPLRREWALICDSTEGPACVVGWERPGQQDRHDRDRTFETIWSVDPQVVREAARIGVDLAERSFPGIAETLGARIGSPARSPSPDLARAGAVLERTLDYMA